MEAVLDPDKISLVEPASPDGAADLPVTAPGAGIVCSHFGISEKGAFFKDVLNELPGSPGGFNQFSTANYPGEAVLPGLLVFVSPGL